MACLGPCTVLASAANADVSEDGGEAHIVHVPLAGKQRALQGCDLAWIAGISG